MDHDAIKAVIFTTATPLGFLSIIICSIPLLASINNKSINTQHILTKILVLTYGSIGCYVCAMIFFTIGNVFLISKPLIGFILIGLFAVSYIISQVLIYWLLMFRVYHTFKDSIYAPHRCTYILFAVMVILFAISSLLGIVYNYLVVLAPSTLDEQVLDHLGVWVASTRQLIDFFTTVYLITLFIKLLLKVTVDINDDRIDEESMESGLIVIQLDASQEVLLNVMTRFFVLTLFATLSTQINLWIGTVSLLSNYFDAYHVYVSTFALRWWLIPFDCMVNSVCLYLMLEANHTQYTMMCSKCDNRSRVCCHRMAKRWIKRSYDSLHVHVHVQNYDNGGIQILDESEI